MKHSTLAAIAVFTVIGAPAMSQAPQAQACAGEEFEVFDFWLGEWDVYNKNDSLVGHNVISKEEGQCLIRESWTATSGNTGQSYNFLDPQTREWRQLWVSSNEIIDYRGNITITGAMRMVGTITYRRTSLTFPFRGTWTPEIDGAVTQFFEQYDPESGTWNEWFTGIYRRQLVEEETGVTPDGVESDEIIENETGASTEDTLENATDTE